MAEEATPFVWEGKHLATYGDIMDAVSAIAAADDSEKAAEFMAAYREVNPFADANVGYLCGYFGHDQMVAALRLFGTEHPIFGGPVEADEMTPERAFQLGQEMGEEMKRG